MFDLKLTLDPLLKKSSSILGDIRTILVYAFGILKKFQNSLTRASILKLLSFPLGLLIVYITKITLDKGIMAGDLNAFVRFTVLGLLIFLLMKVLQITAQRLLLGARTEFSIEVNYDLARRLFGLDYLKIKKLSSAENAFFVNYDYGVVENLVFYELPAFFSFVKIPVFFVLAFLLSWQLSLLVLLSLPLVAVHTVWAARGRQRLKTGYIFFSSRYGALFNDLLINIKLVKSFFKEDWAVNRMMRLFRRKVQMDRKSSVFRQNERIVFDIFSKTSTVVFWLLGGYFIISGRLSLGSFSAVSMYSAMILSEFYNFGAIIQNLSEERQSIKRNAVFIRDITQPEEIQPTSCISDVFLFDRDIEASDITFGYSKDRPLFEGLNLRVPAGKWTLITGPSGAGKTTLLSLLLRLFKPWSGGISIGRVDIRDMDMGCFSRHVSCVHQEPYIFNDTITRNVLLGEKKPESFVRDIIHLAKLDKLADEMSIGYNTNIGELGSSLSGGQKQRVAIARALARSPKILIMDEATSFLDPGMENYILRGIRARFPEMTVLFVTHRNTAEWFADKVFKLEKERVGYEKEISREKS